MSDDWEKQHQLLCNCEEIREKHLGAILGVTIPIGICYLFLTILGLHNMHKFIRAKQLVSTLLLMYVFSMIANVCRFFYIVFQMMSRDREWVFIPWTTAVYAKIMFGISYQSSLFGLKHLLDYHFSKSDQKGAVELSNKKKRVDVLMYAWQAFVFFTYLADACYNYIYFFYVDTDDMEESTEINKTFQCIKAGLDLMLTVLIIWQTVVLIKQMKVLGELLQEEQLRLKILTVSFVIGYLGGLSFYIYETAESKDCNMPKTCTSFSDLMIVMVQMIPFDILPVAILYYQHSQQAVNDESAQKSSQSSPKQVETQNSTVALDKTSISQVDASHRRKSQRKSNSLPSQALTKQSSKISIEK